MSERQKRRLVTKETKQLKRRMIEKVLSNSRVSNVAFNLNLIADGWLELESDPGTFSLLIEDFGCCGAQVDEIYDLEQKFEGPVFGFIFLFQWLNNQQNDRLRNQKTSGLPSSVVNSIDPKLECDFSSSSNNDTGQDSSADQKPDWSYVQDEDIISEIFFAKQMISNSCATHALISILLNCDHDRLYLGPTLDRLKEHTKILSPENRGYAIGNLPELAKAHNSHASYSSLYNRTIPTHCPGTTYMVSGNQRTNSQQQKYQEAYHFVSYVPIKNRLYELDGLKDYPIDHGPIDANEDWTEKFRSVIKKRLLANKSLSNEIRYSLMAVVPDKRLMLRSTLNKMEENQKVIKDIVMRLYKPGAANIDIPNPPYSPLSNGTLTASESGSACNSPTHSNTPDNEDSVDHIDRYFLIKFDKNFSDVKDEDNITAAHQSCIVNNKLEHDTIQPIDMTKGAVLTSNMKKEPPTDTDAVAEAADTISNHKKSNDTDDPTNPEENGKQNGNELDDIEEVVDNEENDVVNEKVAHLNEKYNLSGEPPFEFNILDDMQHVHFAKSSLIDMKLLLERLNAGTKRIQNLLREELDKRRKFKIDSSRRTHNYEPFILSFLSMLAKNGNLASRIEKDMGLTANDQLETTTAKPIANLTTPANTPKSTNNKPGPKIHWRHRNAMADNRIKPKPKYKYVSTGRPVGRPRKYPLPAPPPSEKSSN